jgi:hypothetical protein
MLALVTNNHPPRKQMSLPSDILNIDSEIRVAILRRALAFMETVPDGDRIVDEDGTRWTVTPENRMAVTRMVWVKWLRNINKNTTPSDAQI